MSKRIFTFFAVAIIVASVFAQSPEKMSYQAVIRDANDDLVVSQTIGMQISILRGSTSGGAEYVETQSATTNANGLVSIEIGAGSTTDDFSTLDWANISYYIKTEIDPAGGTSYTIEGTSQLLAVPYALHAKTAANIQLPTTANIGDMTYWNGSAWVVIPRSTNEGATLQIVDGVPAWTGGTPLAIGDTYQGGIVAYILQSGDPGYDANVQHGLIAAPSDQSDGIQWNNGAFIVTGATASALGTGNENTNAIIATQGAGSYAAKICADLSVGGFDDWYLPSIDELYKLRQNSTAIGGFNFSSKGYWSSTEQDIDDAGKIYTGPTYLNKDNQSRVRAVRFF